MFILKLLDSGIGFVVQLVQLKPSPKVKPITFLGFQGFRVSRS